MRIIGGRLRGLTLAPVGAGDPAAHLRPTSDRVREAIFNILTNAMPDAVTGARVLDLFAGTGALGLEALSRGALRVAFVEDGKAAAAILRRNVGLCRAEAETEMMRKDATRLGANPGPGYGLVFLDPPYGKGLGQGALASAMAGGWLARGALVVWEEGAPVAAPAGFQLLDQRKYGDTWVTILQAPEDERPHA